MTKTDTSHFIRVYSNLPLKVREEIIVVVAGEPITWNIAYQEISHDTQKGKDIFKKLVQLEIIE